MILAENIIDDPLYSSNKDEPQLETGNDTVLLTDPVEFEVTKPQLKTITEPEKVLDTGNGIYALKPSIPADLGEEKQMYVDIEKLLQSFNENEAEKIIQQITDKELPKETETELRNKGIISDRQPVKAVPKKKKFFDILANIIYNLINA